MDHYEKMAVALAGDVMGKNVNAKLVMGSLAAAQVFATLQLANEVRQLRQVMTAQKAAA